MKNIALQDPRTNQKIEVEISAEEFEHQQAWRVRFADGKSALIGLNQHRIWQELDGNDLDAELIRTVGNAIESQENPNY
jgi:hypothetical protein